MEDPRRMQKNCRRQLYRKRQAILWGYHIRFQGLFFIVACGLLIAVASLAAEQRL